MVNIVKIALFCLMVLTFGLVASPQTTPPQRTFLKGVFTAKPGTIIELANNNDEVLTVTAGNDGNAFYSRNSFSFIIRYVVGANYSVRIKTAPAGQVCTIYANAEGTVRENANDLRVGCDSAELISRSTDDKSFGTFYDSTAPVIGGIGDNEGRYVAFVSYAAGLGGSTGKFRQIIWRDRNTGETRLISATATGGEGNQNSFAPAISADGKSVAFESYATNLVPTDTNGVRDIFVWNYAKNTITAVSTGQGETETNYQSYEPTISGDGNLVAFTSDATNLIPNIMGISSTNVYLKDIRTGSIQIISVDEKTKKGGGGSVPSISEDGSRIAFCNYSPLIAEDKNNLWDIYVWERGNPKLKRVSTTIERSERNQGDDSASRVVAPTISGNGKFVAFATTASNMVSGDTNGKQDVFVVDVDYGRVTRESVEVNDTQGNDDSPIGQGEKIAITYDGRFVAFSTKSTNLGGNVVVRRVWGHENIPASKQTGLTVGAPAMSRNGSYVIFGTSNRLDGRFQSSGIFATFIGLGSCRYCPQ